MSIDWSKAPDGFPIWLEDVRTERLSEGDHNRSSWACDANGEYTLYSNGSSRGWWTKSREGVDFIAHHRPAPWSGEGLPPVGTVCEWHPNVHGWVEVTILGRHGEDTWYIAKGEEHSQTCRNMSFFRPIRTAEQIAEEVRVKEIAAMIEIIRQRRFSSDTPENPKEEALVAAVALYDAGYRCCDVEDAQ